MKFLLTPISFAVLSAFVFSGCLVVTDEHLRRLQDAGGGDQPDVPTVVDPTQLPVDRCGDDSGLEIVVGESGEASLTVDTTMLTNSSSMCGSIGTPGNDAFVRINVQAGQPWHFHLATSDATRDPVIYMIPDPGGGSCDSRDCPFSSNFCDGQLDEHIGFEPNTDGTWYIGIDDRNMGGGVYTFSIYLNTCNNGQKEHGENCDPSDEPVTAAVGSCTENTCQRTLSQEFSQAEQGDNDNRREANRIDLNNSSNALTVTGVLGEFVGCRYPDVFEFTVPTGGARMTARLADTADCTSVTGFEMVLTQEDPGSQIVTGRTTEANGCPAYTDLALDAGNYFLWMQQTEDFDRPFPYALTIGLQ